MGSLRLSTPAVTSTPPRGPLGWRVSMGLCNLLIAGTILALAVMLAYHFSPPALF